MMRLLKTQTRMIRILALVVILLAILIPATNVLAIDAPDTPSEIVWVFAYDDLLEDGDQGYLVYYNIPYAALPSEPVTDSYLAVLVDVDGTTQVSSVAPVTYGTDDGYNYGVAWIYLTYAESTAAGIGWDEAQFIWVAGNPTLTWVPADPPKTVSGITLWKPATETTSTALGTRVLYVASRIQLEWGVDLVQIVADSRTVLNDAGMAYFMSAIPNLRTMAPDIFASGSYEPITDTSIANVGTGWADLLVTNVIGTPFDLTDMATAFGLSRGMLSGVIWMIIMGVFLYFIVMYLGTRVAIVFFDIMVVFGALIAMLPWALIVGLGIAGGALTAWCLFYKPSSA